MERRGKDFSQFKEIIHQLALGQALDIRYRDHALIGQYQRMRECHLEPDWLLMYEATQSEIVLVRIGSHSDLFDK